MKGKCCEKCEGKCIHLGPMKDMKPICSCHSKADPTVRDWEKEFDDRFPIEMGMIAQWIKGLIREERATAKAEGYEKGKEDAVKYINTTLMWGRTTNGELVLNSKHLTELLEAARSLTDGV